MIVIVNTTTTMTFENLYSILSIPHLNDAVFSLFTWKDAFRLRRVSKLFHIWSWNYVRKSQKKDEVFLQEICLDNDLMYTLEKYIWSRHNTSDFAIWSDFHTAYKRDPEHFTLFPPNRILAVKTNEDGTSTVIWNDVRTVEWVSVNNSAVVLTLHEARFNYLSWFLRSGNVCVFREWLDIPGNKSYLPRFV